MPFGVLIKFTVEFCHTDLPIFSDEGACAKGNISKIIKGVVETREEEEEEEETTSGAQIQFFWRSAGIIT